MAIQANYTRTFHMFFLLSRPRYIRKVFCFWALTRLDQLVHLNDEKNISTRFTAEKRIKLPTMTSNSESQFGIIIVIAFLGLPGTFFWRFSSWEKDHRGKTCDLNPFYLPVKMEKWKLGWNHGKPRFNSWNIQTKNMFQDARQKHCFFMKRLIFSWRSNELNENLRS